MSKSKTVLWLGFLSLLLWWVILNTNNYRDGLGNLYFSFGLAVFSLVSGLMVAYEVVSSEFFHRKSQVVLLSLSTAFFGLGTLIWFYYDYTGITNIPFPSLADIFYTVQFPLAVFGLLLMDNNFENIRKVLLKGLAFFTFITASLLLLSYASFGYIDIEYFLMLYFPIDALSLSVLTIFLVFKTKQTRSISGMLLAQLTWLSGDLFFFSELLNQSFFSASYSDFLYLMATFINLMSVVGYVNHLSSGLILSEDGVSGLRKVQLLIPTSLNSRIYR